MDHFSSGAFASARTRRAFSHLSVCSSCQRGPTLAATCCVDSMNEISLSLSHGRREEKEETSENCRSCYSTEQMRGWRKKNCGKLCKADVFPNPILNVDTRVETESSDRVKRILMWCCDVWREEWNVARNKALMATIHEQFVMNLKYCVFILVKNERGRLLIESDAFYRGANLIGHGIVIDYWQIFFQFSFFCELGDKESQIARKLE